MLDIGRAIRIVRQAKGMGLRQLAESSSISIPFLSLMERGKKQPSLDVVRRISAALEMPSEALILLSQSAEGSLRSEAGVVRDLADSIQNLAKAEEALKLTLEGKANGRKSNHPR